VNTSRLFQKNYYSAHLKTAVLNQNSRLSFVWFSGKKETNDAKLNTLYSITIVAATETSRMVRPEPSMVDSELEMDDHTSSMVGSELEMDDHTASSISRSMVCAGAIVFFFNPRPTANDVRCKYYSTMVL
jgi:hypothetical protein